MFDGIKHKDECADVGTSTPNLPTSYIYPELNVLRLWTTTPADDIHHSIIYDPHNREAIKPAMYLYIFISINVSSMAYTEVERLWCPLWETSASTSVLYFILLHHIFTIVLCYSLLLSLDVSFCMEIEVSLLQISKQNIYFNGNNYEFLLSETN